MAKSLTFNSIFGQNDEKLKMNSIFGQSDEAYNDRKRISDYSELLKTVNYVTIVNNRKNPENVFKRYRANDLCMSALKQTANYIFGQQHKINIQK